MFRSSTIFRELVQSLAKVILLLKHSVKIRRILCDVAACHEVACVLRHTPFHDMLPHHTIYDVILLNVLTEVKI